MTWRFESRRHSLASRGIKTAQRVPKALKDPMVHILNKKQFEAKVGKDFDVGRIGEARTDIHSDGSVHIYIKDIKDNKFQDKILKHELKEVEIFKDLVAGGISPEQATQVAHEKNPIIIDNKVNMKK